MEGLLVTLTKNSELENLETVSRSLFQAVPFIVVEDIRVKKEIPSSYSNATPFVWLSSDIHNEVSDLAHFLLIANKMAIIQLSDSIPVK